MTNVPIVTSRAVSGCDRNADTVLQSSFWQQQKRVVTPSSVNDLQPSRPPRQSLARSFVALRLTFTPPLDSVLVIYPIGKEEQFDLSFTVEPQM